MTLPNYSTDVRHTYTPSIRVMLSCQIYHHTPHHGNCRSGLREMEDAHGKCITTDISYSSSNISSPSRMPSPLASFTAHEYDIPHLYVGGVIPVPPSTLSSAVMQCKRRMSHSCVICTL